MFLHPSLTLIASPHPIVSLWAAHQWNGSEAIDAALSRIDLGCAETALVLRDRSHEVTVMTLSATATQFIAALQAGHDTVTAAQTAQACCCGDDDEAAFELAQTLSLLIDSGAWTASAPSNLEG
jgi:electron transfer flavoprotein alpha/beta subunit